METKERVIDHPSQLNNLWTLTLVPEKNPLHIKLSGNFMNYHEKEQWETALNSLLYICGCDTGAKGTKIGFICGFVLAVSNYFYGNGELNVAILVFVMSVVVLSITGKLYGILLARHKLKKIISRIWKAWINSAIL